MSNYNYYFVKYEHCQAKRRSTKNYFLLTTSFVEQREKINLFLILHSFEGPTELLHPGIDKSRSLLGKN